MHQHSRRRFLRQTGAAAGAALAGVSLVEFLSACQEAEKARTAGGSFKVLAPDEATEIEAVAACIVPTTDTPGAREAGAIYFIDNILSSARQDLVEPVRNGMADLQARVRKAAGPSERFSVLDEEAQIAALTEIERTGFFSRIRFLTLAGLLADPSYGGNRDQIGWKLIGFEGHFGWQPPFGWYDEHDGSAEA